MNNVPKSRYITVLIVGVAIALITMYVSLTNGVFDISLGDVIRTLLRIDPKPDQDLLIFEFRLPRIIIAAFVGVGLGIAGAVIQSITRNALADPGILGINAGAGTAIVIFCSSTRARLEAVTGCPFWRCLCLDWWGLTASFLIYLFSWKDGRLEPQRLLLTGIAIASGLGAVSLFLTLKMNAKDFEMAAVWTSGSIYNANWKYISSILPWLVILIPVIAMKSYILDLFQLDEDSIRSLGVATEKKKRSSC
ncbi:iron ABC transporter permease [Paenibacillus larvae]|nr:iron ABC transporter permease [Paenibacillus larvae]MDT2262467.1 iron ABC transporter permease [Paenibacillus larvae]